MGITIDEAIKRYNDNAEYERTHGSLQGCLDFKQLAEWLKDYKRLLEQEPCEEHQREFIELVVEYPNPDLCTYPEYRGKPYYSIKYRENGKEYVGFGTYKIEMLSQWIKEYFISNIQIPEPYKAESEDKQ